MLNEGELFSAHTIEDPTHPYHGEILVVRYLPNWQLIAQGLPALVMTADKRELFGRVYQQLATDATLVLEHTEGEPLVLSVDDIEEVWEAVAYIDDPAYGNPEFYLTRLGGILITL